MSIIQYECIHKGCTRTKRNQGHIGNWYTLKFSNFEYVCPVHKQPWIKYEEILESLKTDRDLAIKHLEESIKPQCKKVTNLYKEQKKLLEIQIFGEAL